MNAEVLAYARVCPRGLQTGTTLEPWTEPVGDYGLPPLRARLFSSAPLPKFGRMDALCKVAMTAAGLAVGDYRRRGGDIPGDEIALAGGTMLGCLEVDAAFEASRRAGAPSPAAFVYTLPSMFLGEIAIHHGLRGRCTLVSAGRLSGLAALETGVRWVTRGRARAVLVVAADAAGPGLHTPPASAAVAWLLAPGAGPGFALGAGDGRELDAGTLPHGLYGLSELESVPPGEYTASDGDMQVCISVSG